MIRSYGIDTIRAEIGITRPPAALLPIPIHRPSRKYPNTIVYEYNFDVGGIRFRYVEVVVTDSKLAIPLPSKLWVEASLPKVLNDDNIETLRDTNDIAKAIAIINQAVSPMIGWDIDLKGWQLIRLDVTADRHFNPVSKLHRVLHRLANERIARTYPTIQRGSVTWDRDWGAARYAVYDKQRQSRDSRARGQLRVECQAKGHSVIHKAYPEALRPDTVTVGDLLDDIPAMAMQEALIAPIDRLIDRCLVDKPTTITAVIDSLRDRSIKMERIVRLLGIAVAVRAEGWDAVRARTTPQTFNNWRRELRDAGVRADELDLS